MAKDDKSNGGSFLGNAAALSVGGAVGYNSFKKLKKTDIIKPSLDPRSSLLSRVQRIKVDAAIKNSLKKYQSDWAIQRLNEMEASLYQNRAQNLKALNAQLQASSFKPLNPIEINEKTTRTTQLLRREWEAAVDATFPNPLQARTFSSSMDPLEGIRATLRGNSSVLTQRAFHTFESNVGKLLNQGTEAPFAAIKVSDFIKGVPESLTPREVGLAGIQNARLRGTIGQIESALGRQLSVFHRGTPGRGEFTFGFQGQEGSLFRIPEAFAPEAGRSAGLIRTGTGLHNIYAPGVFGILDETGGVADELTFSELKAQRIYEGILEGNLTARSSGLRSSIRGIEDEVGKLAAYMEPNIGGDLSFETIFSSHQMTVLDASGKPVTGEARRIVAEKLYNESGYTPTGTGSSFSLFPEKDIYGPLAAEQDYARKPWQRIRQYTPTESAMAANMASPFGGAEFDFLDSPEAIKRFNGPSGARLKTLYLNEDQIQMLNKTFGITIGDGELLLHEAVKQKLQVSRMRRINLNEINSNVANLFKDRSYNLAEQMSIPALPVQGILGRNAEGKLVSARGTTSIVGFSPNITERLDKTKTASMDLILQETVDMSNVEKVFGGLKGEARFVSGDIEKQFGAALQQAGVPLSDLQGVQAIARVGDLKDIARQKQALISSLVAQNIPGAPTSGELLTKLGGMGIDESERYMSELSTQLGAKSFSLKGGGIGVTQLHFGGEAALTGAGNIGTLEPRVFNLLAGSNPGGLGNEISNEFLERMVRWSPERVSMHEELMKTLGSISGDVKPTGMVLSGADLADKVKRDALMAKGGFVKTGVDQIPHIYVPGYETVPELHPRMVGTGAVVATSQPSKILDDILGDVRAVGRSESPMTHTDFVSRFEEKKGYLSQLVQEAAIGGKGAGSIARGELGGSRALTILSEANPKNQAAFETMLRGSGMPANVQERIVGLPKNYGREMFAEMARLYGNDVIAPMQKRFEAGELVAGMAMRHPTIGPYSMQPVLFKAMEHDGPHMLIPERSQSMTFTGPSGSVTKDIHTGVLTGFAADKDADTALAMLVTPDIEQKLSAQMTSIAGDQAARDHSIRMQLLKPKANKEVATLANMGQLRAAEATKLGITSEQVGILSSNLTKSRVAIMASSLSEERKLRGLSLLEWMEQIPISGKHLQVSEALSGAFEQQMSALSQGAQGNARLLEGAVTSITQGTVKKELMPLFQEGMGIQGGGFVKGFQLAETSSDIANSIVAMRTLPEGAQLAAAAKYSSPSASGAIKIADLPVAMMANQINRGGAAVEGSRAALAAMNKQISSFSQAAKPYLKPLALAAAAGGLTAAILSPGPGTMATGGIPSEPPPRIANPARDDIGIPGITNQRLGSPTAEPHLRQQTVMAETQGAERRRSIRARIQANGVTPEQRQSLSERLSSRYPGSQINVRMQDDRKSLNPHSVNDMIE